MQAFTECKSYDDYLSVIKEYMFLNNSKVYEDNTNGLSFLSMIEDVDDQKKIIRVFKLVDFELSYKASKNNEMFKKINYLLSTGVLFHDYKEYIEDLDSSQLFVLVYGKYSRVDKTNKALLPLFSNKELLNTIIQKNEEDIRNKDYNVFGISDYFFMIEEQYKNNPFDINDKSKLSKFINEMIEKINNNTLHDNVNNMIEYWESDEMNELKRSVLK